jgi:hypothetical protein
VTYVAVTRDTGQVVVVALVCILALGLTAATIDSTVETRQGSGDGFGDIRNQTGDPSEEIERSPPGDGFTANGSVSGAAFDLEPCTPFFGSLEFLVLAFAGTVAAAWLVGRRYGGARDPTVMAVVFLAFLPVLIIAVALFSTCGASPLPGNPRPAPNVSAGDGGGEGGAASLLTSPSVVGLVFGLLAVVLIIGFVALGSGRPDGAGEEAPPEEDSLEAIGDAAGRAAERIEADADVDNEVYDAWKEMTTYLEVDQPASSTPGEFAAAAVDAGMTREDVDELTRLFEEVRYGGADPADREQRAVAALRRIEAAYGGDGG